MLYTSPCGPSSILLPLSFFSPLLSSHLLSFLALLFPSLLGWSIFLSGFGWAIHGSRRGGGSYAEPHLGSLLHSQLPLEWSSPSPAPTPAHQPEWWSTWQYRLPWRSHRYSSWGRSLLGRAGREAWLVMWPLNTGRALCCANTCALWLEKKNYESTHSSMSLWLKNL